MTERIPEDWSHTRTEEAGTAVAALPPPPRIPEDFSGLDVETAPALPESEPEPKPKVDPWSFGEVALAVEAPVSKEEEPDSRRAVSLAVTLLVSALVALALIFMTVEVCDLVQQAAEVSFLLGILATVAAVALFGAAACLGVREWRAYAALRSCQRLRAAHRRYRAKPDDLEATAELRLELERYGELLEDSGRPEVEARVREVKEACDVTTTMEEWIESLETRVLAPMDRKVREVIQKESLNVGLATAISPWGFMDALVTLWRNWLLIKQIARIYQVRAGVAGAVRIFRNVIAAAALADLTHETASTFLGAFRGLGSLLSPVGQGLANAALTARLGLLTQRACRPLPIPAEAQRNILNILRRSVMEEVRRRLKRRTADEGDAAE